MPTDLNPADHTTRSIPAAQFQHSNWFSGPAFLYCDQAAETAEYKLFTLIEPDADDDPNSGNQDIRVRVGLTTLWAMLKLEKTLWYHHQTYSRCCILQRKVRQCRKERLEMFQRNSQDKWAFTSQNCLQDCMSTRAMHIELIETMSTDSFINALEVPPGERMFLGINPPSCFPHGLLLGAWQYRATAAPMNRTGHMRSINLQQ